MTDEMAPPTKWICAQCDCKNVSFLPTRLCMRCGKEERRVVSLLTLRVYQGETLLRTETFTQAVIKVGKLVSSHLRLDDDRVSRMHAVIEVADTGEVSIIDLGSHQGTTVNGVKISKTAGRLRDGDVLRLGDTRLVLGVAP